MLAEQARPVSHPDEPTRIAHWYGTNQFSRVWKKTTEKDLIRCKVKEWLIPIQAINHLWLLRPRTLECSSWDIYAGGIVYNINKFINVLLQIKCIRSVDSKTFIDSRSLPFSEVMSAEQLQDFLFNDISDYVKWLFRRKKKKEEENNQFMVRKNDISSGIKLNEKVISLRC